MRTLLICHDEALLDREGLSRWLGSFSDLVGVLVLREKSDRKWRRIRREFRRSGPLRFLDVLAFRLYYRIRYAAKDRQWEMVQLERLRNAYFSASNPAILHTHSPNSPEAVDFINSLSPDVVIARCKTLLRPEVYSVPKLGTFVAHPGVCPEYRNAHGCFWARVRGDDTRIGMTLLRIDAGVDTGPVYGYFYPRDSGREESHIVLQHRTLLENLDGVRDTLLRIYENAAAPIDTTGRFSATWGQPWLSSYVRWRLSAPKALS